MSSSFGFSFAPVAAALLALCVAAPTQAQAQAPLSIGKATVTIAGTSNVHDYTASTSTVRLVKAQVASGTAGSGFWTAVVRPGALEAFEVAIPVKTLHSTRDGLDGNMHKALNMKAHPEIVYRLKALESGSNGALRAVGTLRIAGVEKDVTFDLAATQADGGLVVKGSVDLLMTDFGIAPPKAMLGMLKTDPKVTVSFTVTLATPLT